MYAAPEGDEIAVYTRGTARLVKGEARVRLGETFRWVANPDIGLTAHLTPHGSSRGLYVASLTTEELVVRENDGGASDVTFDFLVYGLRLGFEEMAILQAKERDALPPMADAVAKPYEGHEDLRSGKRPGAIQGHADRHRGGGRAGHDAVAGPARGARGPEGGGGRARDRGTTSAGGRTSGSAALRQARHDRPAGRPGSAA